MLFDDLDFTRRKEVRTCCSNKWPARLRATYHMAPWPDPISHLSSHLQYQPRPLPRPGPDLTSPDLRIAPGLLCRRTSTSTSNKKVRVGTFFRPPH